MIPPWNNLRQISAASLIISGDLFPARFPPMSTSNRDISLRILPGQVSIELKAPPEYPLAVTFLEPASALISIFSGIGSAVYGGGCG